MAKVKVVDLDILYSALQEHGGKSGGPLKPAIVRKVHTALSLVFAQAVRWEWPARNPAADASPPKTYSGELEPPAAAQVRRLIEEAVKAEDGPLWAAYLLLAVTTGRRRGELCGLRWTEVDLEPGTAAIFRVVKIAEDNKLVIAAFPKSARGKATIALDEGMVKALVNLRAWQDERVGGHARWSTRPIVRTTEK